jgi:hypothetical protein
MILSFFDLSAYIVLSCAILKLSLNKNYFLSAAALSLISGWISFSYSQNVTSAILGVLVLVFLKSLFKRKFLEILGIYALTTVILISLQALLLGASSLLPIFTDNLFYIGATIQIVVLVVCLYVYSNLHLDVVFNFFASKNKVFIYLLVNLFVLTFSILLSWHFNRNGFIDNYILISLFSMAIITVNFVILNNGLKNRFQEEELHMYRVYIPVIENLMDEVRSIQHEYDNRIASLQEAARQSGLNGLSNTLSQLTGEDLTGLIKINNKLIAGLLYSKKNKALERGIEFKIIISNYDLTSELMEYEVIEILGILLDNAFETQVDNNVVSLEIHEEKGRNMIRVSNKHPYIPTIQLQSFFSKRISSKSKDRGYGLYRLKSICKKHNADLHLENTSIGNENFVVFTVLF